MVRLKVVLMRYNTCPELRFQFQYGAIKRISQKNVKELLYPVFQFQYGAIKSYSIFGFQYF